MAVKLKVKTGDPKEEVYISKGRTSADDRVDVRDILSGLVGRGYTALNDDDSRASYNRLQQLVGNSNAQKLMTHMFIFNQRPELKNMAPEARINTFYNTPAGDPVVAESLKSAKGIGYGVLPGFRTSSSLMNQQLAGRVPTEAVAAVDPAVQAIKLKVSNKVK